MPKYRKNTQALLLIKSNATAKDVKELISQIQTTVKKETGYDLECELIML